MCGRGWRASHVAGDSNTESRRATSPRRSASPKQQQADWSFKRLSFNPHFSGLASTHAADWSFKETHKMD